ncbi:MAG: hypothetical protein U0031_08560 [Thermomicrobiales bacterium]
MTYSLQELGIKYGSEKVTHGFLAQYEPLMAPFRDQVFDLLEIGVKNGASIRMWHEYFPKARIIGLNPELVTLADEEYLPRYFFHRGRQDDEAALREIAKTSSLRVVIDNGSPLWVDQIKTFQVLFPFLEPGGVYACENAYTSFGPHASRCRDSATESAAQHFLHLGAGLISDRPTEFMPTHVDSGKSLLRKVRSIVCLPRCVIVTREAKGTTKDRRGERLGMKTRDVPLLTGTQRTIDPRNIILTGLPRSGTTLTCSLLNKLPDTVALHEPMQGRHVAGDMPLSSRSRLVQQFFQEQRDSMRNQGVAKSRTLAGDVPENPFGLQFTDEGLRQQLDTKGEIVVDKELSPDFKLVIKHIASFAAMLEDLVARFPVYALVRNPLAVLASWSTLDAALQYGRLGPAERLQPELAARLDAIDDSVDRQIVLLDWFFAQFDRYLPPAAILRYETVIETGGRALAVIEPEAANLGEALSSRNASELYERDYVLDAGRRLLASDGAFWRYYSRESVSALMAEFEGALARR